jgi:integrase
LENGLNPVIVAELLGHSDASMLSRVYQHLADRHDHMREAALRASAGNAWRQAAAS